MFKKNQKLKVSLALLLCCFMLVLSACGSAAKTENTTAPSEAAAATDGPAKVVDINFYGKIVEYTSGEAMVKMLQDDLKDKYNIKGIQVDWGNLEKVIKTGIASGTPADVYEYWPGAMKTFVENDQALDLTPYLEANDGEWKKTFDPALLDLGKYNGKYYNVPLDSNFSVIYVNSSIFEKAGVAVPEQWSWEQFIAACKTIQEKTGVFPFVISKDLQGWMYDNGLLSLGKDNNQLADLAAGKISTSDPIFAKALHNLKQLYDGKYAYPGAGAITIGRDEAKAAFYQGKVAMMAEVSSFAKEIATNAKDFKATAVVWPAMGKESQMTGGGDGLFIPVNAPNKDASVEVLKTYLGSKIQKIHAEEGYATANNQVEVTDPAIKAVMKLATYISPLSFTTFSPKITDYMGKELLPALVLNGGKNEQSILDNLEKLRLEALKK